MTKSYFIHIDADAFFASVEQCIHRELRGKPIVTGRDGSIAVAMSYQAKGLGVERATPVHIIRKDFPSVQMVCSDYFMYRIFSQRMLEIIRNHIPHIKRSSIDECWANISTDVQDFNQAEDLAKKIKQELELKLQCGFSIGISSSQLLSKMASGMNKPSGLTIIDVLNNTDYLEQPIKKVSGLGKRLCYRLSKMGVIRIKDFIQKYPAIQKNFSIIVDDIYYQLQGVSSHRNTIDKPTQSINKARSFKVTQDKSEIIGQLLSNLESLLKRARAQDIRAKIIYVSLRDAERVPYSSHLRLQTPSRDSELLRQLSLLLLDDIYMQKSAYRYVSVTLGGLVHGKLHQHDLFGDSSKIENKEKLYSTIDYLDAKFGMQCVVPADTLLQPKSLGSHLNREKNPITSLYDLLPGETFFQRVKYPYMGSIN